MVEDIARQYNIDLNNMDSLAQMTLVLALEHELKIKFTMSQIVAMKNLHDIEAIIDEYKKDECQ